MSAIPLLTLIDKLPITTCLRSRNRLDSVEWPSNCPQDERVRSKHSDFLHGFFGAIGEYQSKRKMKKFDYEQIKCTPKKLTEPTPGTHWTCPISPTTDNAPKYRMDIDFDPPTKLSINYYRPEQIINPKNPSETSRPELSFVSNCNELKCTVTATSLVHVQPFSPSNDMEATITTLKDEFYCKQSFSKNYQSVSHNCSQTITNCTPFLENGILPPTEKAQVQSDQDLKLAVCVGVGIIALGLAYTVAQTAINYFSSKEEIHPNARRSR